MKALQKFAALMLLTLTPALIAFLVILILTTSWVMALIIAAGVFWLGLDVCLRGRQ